jgi:hypothetical protein
MMKDDGKLLLMRGNGGWQRTALLEKMTSAPRTRGDHAHNNAAMKTLH